jgi:NADH:ubiquinone oxidoreductase subunit 5 (subunit L)/multisubunit Na+/H+ antiporter MnhA subunit
VAEPVFGASHALEWTMEIGSGFFSAAIVLLAYVLYCPDNILGWSLKLGSRQGLHDMLQSGFYLDRLYQQAIARPYREIAVFAWVKIDESGLDNGLTETGKLFPALSIVLRQWTTGRLSTYLMMILLGFTLIVSALAIGWY